ncbi:2-oxoisovalerate dehydrogenase E2 component (dihydrolipoyl transacylase) [Paenibacillus uliginis N3/975]|uniref:Dihydrolipoamide acetyltransferase component of pyruvate dehydrogenase complex n=1 Tax=Paenibacillus uliginis N3/975 TaxID=1313296 RepID=A0A1X7HJ58_9BACL|nr:dihydrolipoamide acetyltransferase family protein [Paenibacillus uliginis]SMF87608.1 2-oxoisovalerate dehydrogenase E2 component (dihydrolipoyl transacylase) [Paenibacillus uliginis N3/975]
MSENGKMTDVAMPQLAESLVSATIGKWLKKQGDRIEQYEPICEVMTDKVNAEIPSTMDGIMGEILAEEGQTVAVGEIICRISAVGSIEPETAAPAQSQPTSGQNTPAAGDSMRARYSPAVQSLAAEHRIDLNQVTGTGMGGRITRKDVLSYIEHGGPAKTATAAPVNPTAPDIQKPSVSSASPFTGMLSQPQAEPSPPLGTAIPNVRHSGLHLTESPKIPTIEVDGTGGGRNDYFVDVTPIRNTIARNMRQSVSEIPHAWTMIEVDVTNLVLIRNKLKDEFKRNEGVNLTYLAFLLKAVVNAIKDYPIMNSFWAVDKIVVKREINLSLAVGTEDSVMTPVIKRADQKNIAGLAREIDELARKTREGKLTLDDMQGGTFTVNNTGSFGSILSYPIINYPQAAILTFESIVKKPVVINDMIAVRSMANICLSLDHRILDGVICGRFLQRVKDNLEGFSLDTKLY